MVPVENYIKEEEPELVQEMEALWRNWRLAGTEEAGRL